MEEFYQESLPKYNVALLEACLKTAAEQRKVTYEEAKVEYVRNFDPSDDHLYLQSWSCLARLGARLQPSAKLTEALANGTALAYGVYYDDLAVVAIALLLKAQLGENCRWIVWDQYPTSKCLCPFKKAYCSSNSGKEEVVQMVDAVFPCPFPQCK